VEEAFASIESLLASPAARLLMPGDRYLQNLRDVIARSGVRGNLVFDAQIAAVCLEHGATTLLTEDRDFTRFQGIKPLSLAAFLAD
jgi:predicted nucleic acid-binding protein